MTQLSYARILLSICQTTIKQIFFHFLSKCPNKSHNLRIWLFTSNIAQHTVIFLVGMDNILYLLGSDYYDPEDVKDDENLEDEDSLIDPDIANQLGTGSPGVEDDRELDSRL